MPFRPLPVKQQNKAEKNTAQKFFDGVGRFFNEKGRRREAFREAMRGEFPRQNTRDDKEKITDVIKKIGNLKKNESLQEVLLLYQQKELDKLEKSLNDAQKTSQKRYVDPLKLERLAMKKLDEMVIDISLRSQGEVTDIGVIEGIDFRTPEQKKVNLKRQKIAGPLLEKTLLSIGVTGQEPIPTTVPQDTLLPLHRSVPPFVPSGVNTYTQSTHVGGNSNPQKLTKLDLIKFLQAPPLPSTDTSFNYIRQRASAGQQQLAMGAEVNKVIESLRNEISVAKEMGPTPMSHPLFDKKLNEFAQELDSFEVKLKNVGIPQPLQLTEDSVRNSNVNNKYK